MKSLDESIQEIPLAKTCSLYRAACWIAFNERPIEESLAKVVYQKHYEVEVINHEYEGSQWIETEINWQGDNSESKFKEACKYIHSLLIRGEIKASGYKDGDIWDGFTNTSYDRKNISPNFFDPDYLDIDWLNSKASLLIEKLGFPKDAIDFREDYKNIEIRVSDLQKALRQENIDKPKKGRKTSYDWHAIHALITRYVHENGVPDNKSKLAEEIYFICSQKLGEENTPDIESIRKIAVSPVVNAFKDWEKE